MILRVIAVVGLAVAVSAGSAAGQDEAALKSFFEGRRVMVRIDMPGTSDGVNVYPDRGGSDFDQQEYRRRLYENGTAIRAGDSVPVSLVKVKKDLIEFHLAGGGFGTFWDNTSTSPDTEFLEKSPREKDLERRVRDENDGKKRRELQHELDELRERRERENRRIAVQREHESEMKARRIADERLRGGSRFNIRYAHAVPAELSPDQVIAALTEYVEFGLRPAATDARAEMPLLLAPDVAALRKGMSRSDVERMFGRPIETAERREGSFAVTTLVYEVNEQRVSIDFIDEVVVRYIITSK